MSAVDAERLLTIVTVLIGSLASPALGAVFTTDASIAGDDFTYDGQNVVVDGCTLTVNGAHSFASLEVINGGVVTHAPNANSPLYLIDLTITGDVTITADSRIDVFGKGYAAASGPGAGASSSYISGGGAHGGAGGPGSSGAAGGAGYDDIKVPADLGSGGGNVDWAPGGAGGGCVLLSVGGTLTVNGDIRAEGENGYRAYDTQASGGGGGGTIRIAAGHLAGAGTISANAGSGRGCSNGTSGGGAGGRIAVHAGSTSFTGAFLARGYGGSLPAGAGTIFTRFADQACGRLEINNQTTLLGGEMTPSLAADEFDEVIVRAGGRLRLSGSTALTAGLLQVADAGRVEITTSVAFGNVVVQAGGVIAPLPGYPNFDLYCTGDMDIEAGGAINAAGLGYATSAGPGGGGDADYYAGGAGHAGHGGDAASGTPGGSTYGSRIRPVEMGSGGGAHLTFYQPGGAGGGAVRITTDGALVVDGAITADGDNGLSAYDLSASGGGAGGSVYLEAGQLAGSGTISANGGTAPLAAGGGGGGRIALYTCDLQIPLSQLSVAGGSGAHDGDEGTLFHGSPFIEIASQPVGGIRFEDEAIVLGVTASTTVGALQYRWYKDGVDLNDDEHYSGTHAAVLVIAQADSSLDSGDYEVRLTDDCGPYVSDAVNVLVPPPGDANCDGLVNAFDIDPFVLALTSPATYELAFSECRALQADCNLDGAVNAFDIDPFVQLLVGF